MSKTQLTEAEKRQITDILIEQLGVHEAQLTPTAELVHDLGADSLTVMEIILALEEAFHIDVPDTAWEPVTTVQQVYETVAYHLREPQRIN